MISMSSVAAAINWKAKFKSVMALRKTRLARGTSTTGIALRSGNRSLTNAQVRPSVPPVRARQPGSRRLTLGADKAYDVHKFVDDLRGLNVTPHIAQNTTNRSSAIDARTTHHPGYAISQQKRKLTEEPFGWGKTIGGPCCAARLRFKSILTMAAYDLIRLPKLLGAPV